MNISTAVRQGTTHEVCQDYAKRFGGIGVVVCDGCTSSENSELGAMLLANIFGKTVERMHLNENELAIATISEAQSLARYLNISLNCLTSTAIIGYFTNIDNVRHAKVTIYGDGVVVAKKKDGTVLIFDVDFPLNCPFYLRYLLNKNDESNFLAMSGGKYTVSHQVVDPSGTPIHSDWIKKVETLNGNRYSFSKSFSSEEYDEVAICSDGIKRFAIKENLDVFPVDFISMCRMITQHQKNINGEFARRRMKMIFNQLGPNTMVYDDFSFGILNMENRQ